MFPIVVVFRERPSECRSQLQQEVSECHGLIREALGELKKLRQENKWVPFFVFWYHICGAWTSALSGRLFAALSEGVRGRGGFCPLNFPVLGIHCFAMV